MKKSPAKKRTGGKSVKPSSRLLEMRKLINLHEQERRLLAYDIHDGLAQQIVGAKMLTDSMLDDHPKLKAELTKLSEQLRVAINETRRLIRELRPLVIDHLGLVAAIEYLIQEHQESGRLDIEFSHSESFDRLAPSLEGALFRMAQEALTNVHRHAKVSHASVKLERRKDQIVLEVRDRGTGFDPKKTPQHRYGLSGIRERARIFGGRAAIRSSTGKGTTIRIHVPMQLELHPDDRRW